MDRDDAILEYLQGRMSDDDRARFETAMEQDASLAAEVGIMRSARRAMSEQPVVVESEAVWSRLSDSIDGVSRPANDNRSPLRQVLRYAAVALVSVSTWQFAVAPQFTGVPGGFRPVSERPDAFVLRIRFADAATLAEVADLIYSLDGSIVDGPGALGLLSVSFADAEARERAIETLGASDLVDFVQTE